MQITHAHIPPLHVTPSLEPAHPAADRWIRRLELDPQFKSEVAHRIQNKNSSGADPREFYQDILLKIWAIGHRIQDEVTLLKLASRMAHNHACDQARRRHRERERFESLDAPDCQAAYEVASPPILGSAAQPEVSAPFSDRLPGSLKSGLSRFQLNSLDVLAGHNLFKVRLDGIQTIHQSRLARAMCTKQYRISREWKGIQNMFKETFKGGYREAWQHIILE
jgi:hypothetical protein